jgi:hypothetical protein
MVPVNGNSPAYDRIGELNFNDEDGTPIIILCYVQTQSIKGHDNFVLISNNTLDDIQTDINYHSSMSRHVGIVFLRRLSKQTYHYSDTDKHISHKSDSITKEQNSSVVGDDMTMLTVEGTNTERSSAETPETSQCNCQPRIAELLSEIEFLKITGRRMRKLRKDRDNPKKDKRRLKVSNYTCFMSEVQLQGLLDRTKPSKGDEEAMDMTTIDGIRISKYSIKAIKLGKKVSAKMRAEYEKFNAEHVGEDCVFPTKTAPQRFWSNSKTSLTRLNYVMNSRRVLNPSHCQQLRQCIIMASLLYARCLSTLSVRTTPVVEKCDDPRCFSRLITVPKREPGSTKESPPTSYRVTIDALINHCSKPIASTLPPATDEIKKLHAFKYFLKMDAMNAFWSIPLDEES